MSRAGAVPARARTLARYGAMASQEWTIFTLVGNGFARDRGATEAMVCNVRTGKDGARLV